MEINPSHAFCFACGMPSQGSLALCIGCRAPLGFGPPDHVIEGSVLAGEVKVEGSWRPAVAHWPEPSGVATAFPADAEPIAVSGRAGRRLRRVSGAGAFHSYTAALLASVSILRDTSSQAFMRVQIAKRLLGSDTLRARYAAVELVHHGLAELLDALPLSPTEFQWWRALALARMGRRPDAVSLLLSLPLGRYPDAAALAFALGRERDDDRNWAASVIDRRAPQPTVNPEYLLAGVLGDVGRARQWMGSLAEIRARNHVPRGEVQHAARDVLAIIAGSAVPPGLRVAAPPCSLSVLDDLVDLGVRMAGIPPLRTEDEYRYLQARVQPETLTDEDLLKLNFQSEQARRQIVRGETPDLGRTPDVSSSVRAIVAFVQLGEIQPVLRERLGNLAPAVEAFIANPGLETLDGELVRDQTLSAWMAGRLPATTTFPQYRRGSALAELAARVCLRRTLDAVFEPNFDVATHQAREVLRLSADEVLRDEALNLLACAQWQLGNDEAAIQALHTALEGNRNIALQVNLGVVASTLDPEAAATELARLVNDSPTLELRAAAAMKATHLWLSDALPWDSEVSEGMPIPIRDALRTIVVEPLELDTFRRIVRWQANLDSEWLADESSLARATHAKSLAAQVYCAKALGPKELVDALVAAFKEGSPPIWVVEERDTLVKQILNVAFEDVGSWAGMFALNALESGLPVEPHQRLAIVPLAVISVCRNIDPDRGEPADRFIDLLQTAERERDGKLEDLYELAWNTLVASKCKFAIHMVGVVQERCSDLAARIVSVPRYQRDMTKIRAAVKPVVEMCTSLRQGLRRIPGDPLGTDARSHIDAVDNLIESTQNSIAELTR